MKTKSVFIHLLLTAFVLWVAAPLSFAATNIVRMGNYWFAPTNITINTGDTILWSNAVSTAHDTTSSTGLWNSPTFGLGRTYAYKFNNAGYYPYVCALHINSFPQQTGTVTVVSLSNIGPTVAITSPTNGAMLIAPATFTVQAAASDSDGSISQVQFFNGGASLGVDTTSPYNASVNSLAAGNYTLSAVATDNLGAKATNAISITVNNPPSVSISNPASGAVLMAPATFTLAALASDSDGSVSQVEFFQGTTSLGVDTTSPYSVAVNNLAAGAYTLSAVATDNQGAKATNAISITVNSPPTVSVSNPTNGAVLTVPASFSLSATASDSDGTVSQVEFFDGPSSLGVDTTSPYSVPVNNLTAAAYTLSAVATDNRGAKATNAISIAVNSPPTVSISSPTDNAVFSEPANIVITALASDGDGSVSKVEFFRDATKLGEAASSPYSLAWTNVVAGSYTLTAKATDERGAFTSSSPINVTVTSLSTPLMVTISSPADGAVLTAPAAFTLAANASDSDGTVNQVEFFNGASSLGVDPTSPYSVPVNNLAAGAYTLSAVATDNHGAKATNVVSITVNSPPTVSINNPTNGAMLAAPATFTLSATAYDSDGAVSQVEFFEGTASMGVDPASPYSTAVTNLPTGAYALFAVATDNQGIKTTNSIRISVNSPPAVSIVSPTNDARLSTAVVTLIGTAKSSVGVASVEYRIGSGPFVSASGTTNWSAHLTLPPGPNIVSARSVDRGGNVSALVKRTYFQVITSPLTLLVNGRGLVSGATNGQLLQIGRGYSLSAKPATGFVFSNWTGVVSGAAPTLKFLMQSNLTITANFVTNPFIPYKGVYRGLFCETDEVRHASSGYFTLAMNSLGGYSAVLLTAGRRYVTNGQFKLDGWATNLVARSGTNPLTVAWHVDLQGSNVVTGVVSDGNWTAPLLGDRAVFDPTNNPAPWSGRYTLVIPGTPGAADSPEGDGDGTVLINRAGGLSFSGVLADNTRLAQIAVISKDGHWPLYASLYAGKGSLLGWVNFDTNQPTDDLWGPVSWIKPLVVSNRFYPGGFTVVPDLTGSRYLAPTPTNSRVLALTNALVVFTGGGLAESVTNAVSLSAANKVTNGGPNSLALGFNVSTGLFAGKWVLNGSKTTNRISGVVLQKANVAAGFFLGTNNQSGRVVLQPLP